jgi:vancomycin resistance protein YoaR
MRFPHVPLVPLFGTLSLAVVAAAAAGVFAVRDRLYAGESLPGVGVAQPRLEGEVDLIVAGARVQVAPGSLLQLDEEATRRAELAAGRDSTAHRAEALLLPLPPRRLVQPVLRVQPDAWAELLARLDQSGHTARAATVAMRGLQPVVHPGRDGTRVDRRALFAALVRHTRVGQSPIHVHWISSPPALNDEVAGRAAAVARRLVSAPVELRYGDVSVGSLAPAQLARLVRFREQPHAYVVDLDRKPLASLLRPLVHRWARAPVDATFRVDGKRAYVVPAKYGLDLNARAGVAAVLAAGRRTANRAATLTLARVHATFTTAAARKLGIRQRLVSYTTTVAKASPAWVRDLRLLVDRLANTIVRRKQVFSFNRTAGQPSGLAGGQVTVGGLVVPAIAGAVGQTATSLFNAAFRLGLPIVERHNFGSYVGGFPPGRDAAVSWDGPDLKFRNDLKHPILVAASSTGATVTVALYGTSQPRLVGSVTGLPTNWTRPPLAFPTGARVAGATGEDGFDITIDRTVSEHGKVLRRDTFASHYAPAGATIVRRKVTPSRPFAVLRPR